MLFTDKDFNQLRFRLMDMLFSDYTTDFEKEYIRKVIDIVDRLQRSEVLK